MTRSQLVSLLSLFLPGLLFGCSEAVPPAAEGAWMASVNAGSHVASCNLDSIQPILMGEVDATSHNRLEKDTVNDMQVYCSVKSQGSTFDVDASAASQLASLQIRVGALPSTATESDPASGWLSLAGPPTANRALTTPDAEPCNFYFANDEQRGQLADGRVWLTFSCPTVADVSISRECAVQIGYAAFQNCE